MSQNIFYFYFHKHFNNNEEQFFKFWILSIKKIWQFSGILVLKLYVCFPFLKRLLKGKRNRKNSYSQDSVTPWNKLFSYSSLLLKNKCVFFITFQFRFRRWWRQNKNNSKNNNNTSHSGWPTILFRSIQSKIVCEIILLLILLNKH